MEDDIVFKLIPIGISLFALLLSAFSLGWNIYRDVLLKAKVVVKFSISRLISAGKTYNDGRTNLVVSITNHGPGIVDCRMICLKKKVLFWTFKNAIMLHDYTDPMSGNLPKRLEVGEVLQLLLQYNKDCFLNGEMTHIGISDSFGRIHWTNGKDIAVAKKSFKRDFLKSNK